MNEQQIKDLSNERKQYNKKDFPETQYKTYSISWFNECFKIGCKANDKQKDMSIHIIKKYNISGICDPAYIANLIALYPDWIKRLFFCYNTCIKKVHTKKEYLQFVGDLK